MAKTRGDFGTRGAAPRVTHNVVGGSRPRQGSVACAEVAIKYEANVAAVDLTGAARDAVLPETGQLRACAGSNPARRGRCRRPPVTHCLGWCLGRGSKPSATGQGVGDECGKKEGAGNKALKTTATGDEEPFR